MSSLKRILGYGFLILAIPFIVAIFIFPLRENERPLFESIMPVAVALAVVICTLPYNKKIESNFLKEDIYFGLWSLLICIVIDLLMFMWGPMKMAFIDYMKDIGVTYLMIPVITYGIGKAIEEKKK
ncbi:MAG: hypothetical protein L0Y79_03795 [Chlorobi bacterium]|nr:hypothetical protein [Chlorobiota bacterium]MCI0715155.1 hypothetical protein [Chlorobiota bacterium]